MRWIFPMLLCLAGCGPDAGAIPGGSSGDNCAPAPARVDSLAIARPRGAGYAVGDAVEPAYGGQGLPMSAFDLLLTGDIPSCIDVVVHVGNAQLVAEKLAMPRGDGTSAVSVFLGPVGLSYDIDATVGDQHVHASIVNGHVSALR
jgi:hypothetical protein